MIVALRPFATNCSILVIEGFKPLKSAKIEVAAFLQKSRTIKHPYGPIWLCMGRIHAAIQHTEARADAIT